MRTWTIDSIAPADQKLAIAAALEALRNPVTLSGEEGVVIGRTAYDLMLAAFQRLPALPRNRALVTIPNPSSSETAKGTER